MDESILVGSSLGGPQALVGGFDILRKSMSQEDGHFNIT